MGRVVKIQFKLLMCFFLTTFCNISHHSEHKTHIARNSKHTRLKTFPETYRHYKNATTAAATLPNGMWF
jgi:hypothetical protein